MSFLTEVMVICECALIFLIFQSDFINGQNPVVNVQDANVILGKDAVITCSYTLSGSRTFNAAQWYNSNSDGDQLDVHVNTADTNPNGRYTVNVTTTTAQTGTATLTIANTVLSDDGYYLCRIVDSSIFSGENNGNLIVQYLETPVLKSDTLSAMINDTATFTCTQLIGEPTQIIVRWTKENIALDISDTDKYPSSDATLIINKVDEMDEGSYRCVAENAAYNGNEGKPSNLLELSVALTTTSSTSSRSTTQVPKSGEGVCNSTGLVVGMTFVGVLIGFIICLIVVFIIRKIEKSKSQAPTSTNDNQSGQQAYMTYTGETDKEDNHTYQDLQKKDDNQAVYNTV
ncbi:V-set and immunoglobulin domain-containing protein 1-like [Antedon mediterranea]|uniref:V-set and immunoglobulin domain-containing protein 1-like n=1 Tax=Antedon mediterranea TaxID=105859 RepID=UPI003AF74565